MKTLTHLLTAVVALAFAWASYAAVTSGAVSKAALTASQTNQTVIWPGASGKCLVLRSWDVTGDNAASVLTIGGGTLMTRTTAANAYNTTNLTVTSTNGFSGGDLIVIQRATGVCTWAYVDSLGTLTISTDRNHGASATYSCASGDQVWLIGNSGAKTIGNASANIAGNALWGCQVRAPLLLSIHAAAGTSQYIRFATAEYVDYDSSD